MVKAADLRFGNHPTQRRRLDLPLDRSVARQRQVGTGAAA
jgi:hypothetical protein